MIDTGTESLPMVAIFMPLADAVCLELGTGNLLRKINTLSLGDNIVTMRRRKRNERGRG